MAKQTLWVVLIVAGLAGAGLLGLGVNVWDERTTGAADTSDRSAVTLGEVVYREHCAACHGERLEGQPNWRVRFPDGRLPAPPHDATGHTWHHPDQHLFDIVKYGTAALVGGRLQHRYGGIRRPAFGSGNLGRPCLYQVKVAQGNQRTAGAYERTAALTILNQK